MKTGSRDDVGFAVRTAAAILIAHAVAYFIHEYCHSVTAWMLGYMADPLALDYGGASPANLLLLLQVSDNVPYAPIEAGGHGLSAAVIALAGPFLGNAALYLALYACRQRTLFLTRTGSMALFWLLMMCAGNVWSYVPIRALADHADIAIAARGLGVPSLLLFPVLLLPSAWLAVHFFRRACPVLIPRLADHRPVRVGVTAAMTTTWFFMFFGGVGLFASYGLIAQVLSLASIIVLMPCVLAWLGHRLWADASTGR